MKWPKKAVGKARKILSDIREDEHKLKLSNHLVMIAITTVFIGLTTGWAFSAIAFSGSGPLFAQEAIDFYFKV